MGGLGGARALTELLSTTSTKRLRIFGRVGGGLSAESQVRRPPARGNKSRIVLIPATSTNLASLTCANVQTGGEVC